MLALGDEIIDVTKGYVDRTQAIIIVDDKVIVSDENHQCAILDYMEKYWEEKGIDIGTDEGHEDAVEHTDMLFHTGQMHGFDVFDDYKGKRYLLAHYPQSVEPCLPIIKEYAKKNNLILGTFGDTDKLGCQAFHVET